MRPMKKVKLTPEDIEELKSTGGGFVRDWLSDGGDPEEFDGQSEAVDLADGLVPPKLKEAAADYVYEGMLEAIKEAKPAHQKMVLP